MKYKIICHGGAWSIPDAMETLSVDGIQAAARVGQERILNIHKL